MRRSTQPAQPRVINPEMTGDRPMVLFREGGTRELEPQLEKRLSTLLPEGEIAACKGIFPGL